MNPPRAAACASCRHVQVRRVADFGEQAAMNRYRPDGDSAPDGRRALLLGWCRACGLLQLENPAPAEELAPPYPWISYKDPQAHLDDVAERLSARDDVDPHAGVWTVGPASAPLAERLRRRGFSPVDAVAPEDYETRSSLTFDSTAQSSFDPAAACRAVRRGGKRGLVLALHVLEHARDPRAFLGGTRELLRDRGRLVVEVPDTRQALDLADVTAVWDEHSLYFTSETLPRALARGGFRAEAPRAYPYALEDSLVCIAAPEQNVPVLAPGADEEERVRRFASACARQAGEARKRLEASGSPVALLGAGHRACAFLNLLDVDGRVDFVLDDDPNKAGLRMPGSGVPILPGNVLASRRPRLCLLAVSPESEENVRRRHGDYLAAGGRFASIYPRGRDPLLPSP